MHYSVQFNKVTGFSLVEVTWDLFNCADFVLDC